MIASPLILTCLVIMTVCAVAATLSLILTSRDVRRAAGRFNALMPRLEEGMREMRQAAAHVRRFAGKADRAAQQLGTVIDHACEAADGVIEQVHGLQDRAQASLGHLFGNGSNGAGAASRRHHRSR